MLERAETRTTGTPEATGSHGPATAPNPRCAFLEAATGRRFQAGTRIELLQNGAVFPALEAAIDAAEESVEMVVYIWWGGAVAASLARTLKRAARRGVAVRLIVDGFGGLWMNRRVKRILRDSEVDLRFFRPVWRAGLRVHQRTHRKIVVIDSKVAFTGGFGIDRRWTGDANDADEWRDVHYRVGGPAVRELRASFLHEWLETGGDLPDDLCDVAGRTQPRNDGVATMVVSSVSTPGHSDVATVFLALMKLARRRMRIATPYFVPDGRFLEATADMMKRGVSLDLLVPTASHADSWWSRRAGETSFERMLDAGARIYRYETSLMHTKLLVVDDDLTVLGSANFNQRSMRHDDEVMAVVCDEPFAARMAEVFDGDVANASREVSRDEWSQRGAIHRMAERLASLMRLHV